MMLRNKSPVKRHYFLLIFMLTLLSACVPGSSAPSAAATTEQHWATLTPSLTQTATITPTLAPPSCLKSTDTLESTLQPTLDPLISDLPIQPYAKLYTVGYLSSQEQAKIYATVIRRLAGPDDSYRGALHKSFLFIQKTTDDWWGDHGMPMALPQEISWSVQYAVGEHINDLSMNIKWVDSREEVDFDSQDQHVNDGVILYLGNFFIGNDQRLFIAGGVFYADAAAQGQTYVFEYINGEWILVGRTCGLWIS